MKISQREKTMLTVLVVGMILAVMYMLILKPMMAAKTELQLLTGEEKAGWEEKANPIIQEFGYNEAAASTIWSLQDPALSVQINNLYYNNTYLLGNRITNLKGTALELSNSSVLHAQSSYYIFAYIKEQHFDPYIDFLAFSIAPEVETEYKIPGSETSYTIVTSRITIQSFSVNDFNTDNFFAMLDVMEKCSYIAVESVTYDPASKVGSISILILMTPGDLGDYDVIVCPDCGKYIEADSIKCKYCGYEIDHGDEE